jgi:RNA polymerase sigma-70 factor (ECF subfamily)
VAQTAGEQVVAAGSCGNRWQVSGEAGERELVALMERVAGGDREAFRALYARTVPKLFGSVRRILSDKSAAEDAVQEAYVRIWTRARDFDPAIASPVAWMSTIARHAAIDAVRRGAERISAASATLDDELIERIADPASGGERLMAGRRLADCLKNLDEERRGMVLLAYCYGWSREELSQRFQRPVATVKTLLRRGLIALKECLGDAR